MKPATTLIDDDRARIAAARRGADLPAPAFGSPYVDLGREVCGHLGSAERREWLVTNGAGGYASGTVAGLLTRRYHGLLVAATRPPLRRALLVAKLDVEASYDGRHYELYANRWADGTVESGATRHLERFHLEGAIPVWTWALGDALLEQRIFMLPGEQTTVVHFSLVRGRRPVNLLLRALVNHRDHHATVRSHGDGFDGAAGRDRRMDVALCAGGVRVLAHDRATELWLRSERAAVSPHHTWYRAFWLAAESARGLEATDDHLDVAHFKLQVGDGQGEALVLSTEPEAMLDADALLEERRKYEREVLLASGFSDEPAGVRQLVLAADQFIVRRATETNADGRSIIAGYPWFGDWGRDTMIALPGLLLTTGRFAEAKSVLYTWASFVDEGMLPNRFPEGELDGDDTDDADYNTVDATLWFIEAVRAYHAATGDNELVAELFPTLEGIIDAHRAGTRFGIRTDPDDGLLRAGGPGLQLTWMDAKVGDWVVTPRVGKPVEVNALWYNALRSLSQLAGITGRDGAALADLADQVEASFQRFWNPDRNELYDVLDGPSGDDPTLRPNQLFAVSLHHSPLTPKQQRAVVEACQHRMVTSHGLRSLDPEHPAFAERFVGGVRERDGAYHQGTVWGWLIGPFVEAHLRVFGDRPVARSFLMPFAHHLRDHGLGTVAECFDGDAPFAPRGCIAQAWSVAEVIRAWALTTPE